MLFWIVLVVFLIWVCTAFFLSGENLTVYNYPRPVPFDEHADPSEQHLQTVESFADLSALGSGGPRKERLKVLRGFMDSMGEGLEFDGEIVPVDSDGIKGEWVIPPDCDDSCRLLYIHGGAWLAGSPLSHRAITTKYAMLTGGAVFSLDYRLLPENTRQAGIDDCRNAYCWLLENGSAGKTTPATVYISGDSAGGNLTLSLIAWIRDQGLRAPDAVVALSPATDGTMGSPSLSDNLDTDHMLGPAFGKLIRVPRWVLQWGSLISNRISPSEPRVSPVFGNLDGLPPTLVHASQAEMLLDDGVRYVNKAKASGSPVELQTWAHMLHVWHIFERQMPEAQQAFAEIGRFLELHRKAPAGEEAAA